MSWFDEQLKQRKQHDQEAFGDSLYRLAGAVTGERYGGGHVSEEFVTKDAIEDILHYYHYKSVHIPDEIKDPKEQLAYAMRPHGMMYRTVDLEDGWWRDAYGAMIAYRSADGLPVAVYPKTLSGYWFYGEKGKKTSVGPHNADAFKRNAICFYRPLPMRSIGIRDLFVFMKNCIGLSDFLVLVLLTLAVEVPGLVLPHISSILTGFVVKIGRPSILMGTAVFLLCMELTKQLMSVSKDLGMNRLQTKISLGVDSSIMMRLLSLPVPFFREYSSGELSSRSDSLNQLCSMLVGSVLSVGLTSVSSLLYVTEIYHFAPGLMAASLIVILATVTVMIATTFMQMKISREKMHLAAKENGLSYALISGVRKIRLAGAEKRAFAQWANVYAKEASLTYNPPLFMKINNAVNLAVTLTGTGVLYYLAVKTNVTPSNYIGFSGAYGSVMGAFSALAGIVSTVAQIKPVLEMAEPILKAEPEHHENRETVTKLNGNIELNNVYFRYKENMPYVVDGMSLKIKAGEYVAIVGRTGCGKSTLMRLLLGFEKPEKGAVYYDGKDINRLDLQALRRKIGTVTQNGSLFQGDIYSNIVICEPTLSLDEAWKAAETAGIADDIRAMPMGMHTIIAEGQGGISGGQKQRLMIARAIAPKPKILMFDEATSALDNRTQRKVSDALDQLKCTRIVIAHRLSTIRHCDRILVLDRGKITEEGTYEELIKQNGYFADLVRRQRLDIPGDANKEET